MNLEPRAITSGLGENRSFRKKHRDREIAPTGTWADARCVPYRKWRAVPTLLNASPSSRLIAWSMALTLGLFSLISITAPSGEGFLHARHVLS